MGLVKIMGFPGNYSSRAAKAAVRMWQLAPMKLNKVKTKALDSPILIGKVLPGRTPYEEASGFRPGDLGLKERDKEVRIPYFVYDKYYKAFFEHEWDFAVKDEEKVANEGDIVLIQRLAEVDWKMSDTVSIKETAEGAWWEPKIEEKGIYKRKDVTHQILEVIYKLGDIIEPTTKKPVVADRYRSEIAKTAKLYGKSNSDFDYNKAPQRGSEKDKRDFTHRKTYKKWH